MSAVLGVDLSSFALDLVLLDEDSAVAERHQFELAGASSFDRCRHVRHVMPSRSWLEGRGVYLVAIEKPTAASFKSAAAHSPFSVRWRRCCREICPVWSFSPAEWKRELGVSLQRKPTADQIAAVIGDVAHSWPQDALDACGVAYAAREINRRAIERAAA